jgi:hypothetical protein
MKNPKLATAMIVSISFKVHLRPNQPPWGARISLHRGQRLRNAVVNWW